MGRLPMLITEVKNIPTNLNIISQKNNVVYNIEIKCFNDLKI